MPIGGKLSFKGDDKKKKKKKSVKPAEGSASGDGAGADGAPAAGPPPGSIIEVKRLTGIGRLLTSGTTVTGKEGTKFTEQLAVGDVIYCMNESTLVKESAEVRMVLSNVSIAISEPFMSDIITAATFDIDHAVRVPVAPGGGAADSTAGQKISTGNTLLTYRVKTGFSYKIVTEKKSKSVSNEQLLNMRAKTKSDRMCM